MAEVDLNPVFEGFSRKIGDLVFYNRSGDTFVRRLGNYKGGKTEKQLEIRSTFSAVAGLWKLRSDIMQTSWNANVKSGRISGYNDFISTNFSLQRNGEPIQLFKELGQEKLVDLTALPGNAGEINCAFVKPAGSENTQLTVFSHKIVEGLGSDELLRHDAGDAIDTYTITGLDNGAEYFVYAVLTDNVLHEATVVSQSIASRSVAGS